MMSLQINNQYAKKCGIGKNLSPAVRTVMLQEQIVMAMNSGTNSTMEEGFCQHELPHGRTALWGPGGVPGEWSDVCGFIKPPGSGTEWHIRMHGAFEIPHETVGIKVTDHNCHHQVWIHLLHVNARLVDRTSRDRKYWRPSVRKRNSPCEPNKEKRQSR